jgi:serine/threonine-protein kinase ATR
VYLLSTLNSNRDAIQTLFSPGTIDQGSRACFAALLNIGKRFGPGHDDLDELIISCIGAIGAIDPDYLEDMQMITFRSREKLKFMHDKESMKKLCCFFLRSFLVPVFRSVKDPRTQDRYAYSIQEILKICEFHPDLPLAPSHSQMKVNVVKSEVMELWLEFDQDMRTSIYPLLKTKYQMSKPSFESLQAPLISNVSRFNEWVTKFSAKQTMSIQNHDSSSFFQVLCGLVYSDANAASFFLPYILLHVIVTRSSSVKEVEKEIQAVLTKSLDSSQELEHLSSQVNLILFYCHISIKSTVGHILCN